MKKPLIISVHADNGEHSHWALIDTDKGEKLWSEDSAECKAMGYPVKPTELEIELTAQLEKERKDKEVLAELLKSELDDYIDKAQPQAKLIIQTLTNCGITI